MVIKKEINSFARVRVRVLYSSFYSLSSICV
nr:MAG TPA: hypothetical protein [Caudoviricetes sp.]